MVNECLLIGCINAKIERSKTKNGFDFASTRLEVTEAKQDGSDWRTYIPIAAFGKQAEQLAQFCTGDLTVIKGRIGWSQADGLCVTVRSIDRLALERVESDAA